MTADQVDLLRRTVAELLPEIRELRHLLHTEPEIHLQEHRTRAKIAAALADAKLNVREPLMETDLIAELPGKSARTICLRADIDALPIEEQTGVPWTSTVPGMMHACGHDGHMAMLVGTILTLDRLRDLLPVTVRFVFQPGEEMVAGGKTLVARGACDGAEAAFALHGGPGRPVGTVGTCAGPFMAAAGFFDMAFRGRGGHAAMPHLANNPIVPAARAATRLAELHDELHEANGSVVTVSSFQAGHASNVIPDEAHLIGTIRFLEAGFGEVITERMRALAAAAVAGTGVTAETTVLPGYDLPVINDPGAVDYLRNVVTTHLGDHAWHPEPGPVMTSEDFAFYLRDRPGAMFWLGLGEKQPSLHNPAFDFNDDALETGILTFCLIALNYR